MKVYNTLTNKKEEFVPIEKGKLKMYACGITVYDQCHIGHARQAITYDMISNYFRYKGYDVTYVRNYTDVDDKIIAKANALNENALHYSKRKIDEAEIDLAKLEVRDANIKPKASENIQNIIDFVSELINKGYAYPTEKGDVYYSVKKFKNYGKLSNRKVDELLNGVRVDVEDGKKDPLDFALWKSAKPGEIYWESPWGKGRPGWHIECSTMIKNTLGETIDIHGGGKDLVFPHHENEIAQSEALTGKNLANYWIHNGLIKINGQKMSKSLGNSMTIKEAIDKYNSDVIKYTMFSKNYNTDIDLNAKEFAIAEKQIYYFYNSLNKMNEYLEKNKDAEINEDLADEMVKNIENKFVEIMDDDFNTASAIAELFKIFKFANGLLKTNPKDQSSKLANIKVIKDKVNKSYGFVFGMLNKNPEDVINELRNKHLIELDIPKGEIEKLIEERKQAKSNRDYAKADEIREYLDKSGIILNDSKEGTTWDIKELYSIND